MTMTNLNAERKRASGHGMNLWILCSSKVVVNPIVNAIFNTI